MKINYEDLRSRFLRKVFNKWSCANTYDSNYKCVGDFPCVYFFVSFNLNTGEKEIVYVGSTTNLVRRYRVHRIPNLIRNENVASMLFFKEMNNGFYDFERKLIKKLRPKFNVQHKK